MALLLIDNSSECIAQIFSVSWRECYPPDCLKPRDEPETQVRAMFRISPMAMSSSGYDIRRQASWSTVSSIFQRRGIDPVLEIWKGHHHA